MLKFPFAINIHISSFMCFEIINLFAYFFAEDETAFDLLYCVAFKLMDTVWLAMHASYMEFNASLFYFDSFYLFFLLNIEYYPPRVMNSNSIVENGMDITCFACNRFIYRMMKVTWVNR
jgi:hypothetical protein